MIIDGLECKKHPRYQGINRPRAACAECWGLYIRCLITKHGEHKAADKLAAILKRFQDEAAGMRTAYKLASDVRPGRGMP